MRYLVAPDKFKGNMTAPEVAEAIASGLRDGDPKAEVDLLPVADGGEGTARLLAAQLNADTKQLIPLIPWAEELALNISPKELTRFLM
jgi:glycerate kinase